MQVAGWLTAVLILGVLSVSQARRISASEQQKMQKAMSAGYRFTAALRQEDFQPCMDSVLGFSISWTMGFKIFSAFLGTYEPEDALILDAISDDFTKVNKNLDHVNDRLIPIKNIIKWRDMEIKFDEIENQIRVMDGKLMSVMNAQNKKGGIHDFLRTYNDVYKLAGLRLFEAIARNSHLTSKNLLTAAMQYSDNHRPNVRRFMQGLMSLVVKAVNIEIAHQEFSGASCGEGEKWRRRFLYIRDAMQKADDHLGVVWKFQVRREIEQQCKKFKHVKHHYQFTHAIYYGVLHDKYSFMNWHVMSYDPVAGNDQHRVAVRSQASYLSFGKYGRNIVIVSSEKKAEFDRNYAQGLIKDRQCPFDVDYCGKNGAKVIYDQTPMYGNSKVFIQNDIKNHVRSSRYVTGVASLYKGSTRIDQYIGLLFG